MAVTAFFSAGNLSIFADNLANTVEVSRDAAGKILINGGAVAIRGGTATVANVSFIQAFGLGGNDTLTLNESNGALPRAFLFGGTGNDTTTGGSGADQLFGQAGNDTILGKGGNDFIFGGEGNDVLIGGDGDDQVFGEAGNDRMIWNPGDDSDLFEGGAGIDTAEVNGGNGAEVFTITANGSRVRFDRTNPAPFSLDIGTTEHLVVNANGGDDLITASGNLASLIQITVDGGAGNDTILGGNGNDLLLGGDGDDIIDGNQGDDVAFLGAGNDLFIWDPGDGSDIVEGQDGIDTMLFNGANIGEVIDVSANGRRVRFFRNIANIVMDLNDVEVIDFNALGGADTITINNLSGTDVNRINLNLSAAGSGGDGQTDTITAKGTNSNDVALLQGNASSVTVLGLAATIAIAGAEVQDVLKIDLLAEDDVIDATGVVAGALKLHLSGGDGDDVIIGSNNGDILEDGAGDDVVIGGTGNDTFIIGSGDNIILDNGGIDTVLSNSSFTLGTAFENLVLTGTATNGTGNSKDNQITGNNSNNLLQGLAGNDTLIGVDATASNSGANEKDTLTGGTGNDVFVLGVQNNSHVFYSSAGANDFALITDFGTGDLIQIKGSLSNYTLRSEAHVGSSALDTAIYLTANGANELIAVVQDVTGLTAQAFRSVA